MAAIVDKTYYFTSQQVLMHELETIVSYGVKKDVFSGRKKVGNKFGKNVFPTSLGYKPGGPYIYHLAINGDG